MKIPELDQYAKNTILIGFLAGILISMTAGALILHKEAPTSPSIIPEHGVIIDHGEIGGMVILSEDHPTNEQEFNNMLNRTGDN